MGLEGQILNSASKINIRIRVPQVHVVKITYRVDFPNKPARLRDRTRSRLRIRERFMDLNYLYHRHQVSLFMAENADCGESRRAHRALADGYAARIACARCPAAPLSVG